MSTPTILQEIVANRRTHLPEIHRRLAGIDVAQLPVSTRSLYSSLKAAGENSAFIMECKSASPSLGLIRSDYKPGEIAKVYSKYASGISVLCEPDRFGGDYTHLAIVAATTHLPVLCKDFIIDEIQVYAARHYGADAILLMLSVLDDATYARLAALADSLGMDVLTEVVDEEEVARANALGAKIVGINHRDLHDLSIDLDRSGRLAPLIHEDAVVIAESGVRSVSTVRWIGGGRIQGFLVGSHLTGFDDVDLAARELVFGENKVCGLTSSIDAQAAAAAGAVWGGLIRVPESPRYVTQEQAVQIVNEVPGLKFTIVSRETSNFGELLFPGVSAIQLHAPNGSVEEELALVARAAEEIPAVVENTAIWRAVDMSLPHAVDIINALEEQYLVDVYVLDNGKGGTGAEFDWEVLSQLSPEVLRRSFIAGGVGPQNAAAALATGAQGVDMNSGVEFEPGRKDAGKLNSAFAAIRGFHYVD